MGIYRIPKIIGKSNKPSFGARVNWHHPLSQGLVGAWLFNEGVGFPFDLIKAIRSQQYGGTLLPSYKGDSLYFNNAALQLNAPISSDYTKNFSIVWKTTMDNVQNYNQRININGDWAGWTFHVETDYGGGAYCGTDAATQMGPWAEIPAGTFVTGNTYVNCYTLGHGIGSFYVNGKLKGSRNQNDSAAWTQMYFGQGSGGVVTITGTMYYLYVYGRTLSSIEVISLYANPYQMLLHPVWDAYYVSEAAPPPTGGKSIFGYDSIFHAGGIIQT